MQNLPRTVHIGWLSVLAPFAQWIGYWLRQDEPEPPNYNSSKSKFIPHWALVERVPSENLTQYTQRLWEKIAIDFRYNEMFPEVETNVK